MHKSNTAIVGIALSIIISGCSSVTTTGNEKPDLRPCAKNFTTDGSMTGLSGKRFMTSMSFPNISKKTALNKISQQISFEGQTIKTLDRDSGIIIASQQDLLLKDARETKITASVEERKGGTLVNIQVLTGFGMVTSEDAVKDYFCRIINYIGK
ncbi:MAG: hypothetical protein AB3X41_02850 [Leptothrix ochracea]|uniref:hypothetical protein n=1 Tax=Leptothrix ochracea TaxID=735331 RepID=UPI0034E28CA0